MWWMWSTRSPSWSGSLRRNQPELWPSERPSRASYTLAVGEVKTTALAKVSTDVIVGNAAERSWRQRL